MKKFPPNHPENKTDQGLFSESRLCRLVYRSQAIVGRQ